MLIFFPQRIFTLIQSRRIFAPIAIPQYESFMQTPKDRLRILDTVVMMFTMIGISIMAYKTVVTVIAVYMIVTLNIRKDIL